MHAEPLADVTPRPFLTSRSVWKNNVGADGARALAEALKANTTLTSLKYVSGFGVAVVK